MFFDRHSTGPLTTVPQNSAAKKTTRCRAVRSAGIAAVERLEQRALFSIGLGLSLNHLFPVVLPNWEGSFSEM